MQSPVVWNFQFRQPDLIAGQPCLGLWLPRGSWQIFFFSHLALTFQKNMAGTKQDFTEGMKDPQNVNISNTP